MSVGALRMARIGLVQFENNLHGTYFVSTLFVIYQCRSFLSVVLYLWAELVRRLSRQNAQRAGWRSGHLLGRKLMYNELSRKL
jgi:hypothetical protein